MFPLLCTGETFPGVGFAHALQSDQRPGDSGSHAEAPSSRLHCRKYTRYWWWNTGKTHLPRRLLEGDIELCLCVSSAVSRLLLMIGFSHSLLSRPRWSIWSWHQPCCRKSLAGTSQTVWWGSSACQELDQRWLTWLWTSPGTKCLALVGTHSWNMHCHLQRKWKKISQQYNTLTGLSFV